MLSLLCNIFVALKYPLSRKYVIGTRGSQLALWQANHFHRMMTSRGHSVEIKIIKTKGDKIQNLSFDKIEGKGFFTKELEDALLDGDIDVAVHSLKDLSTSMPDGLLIGAVSERAAPNDILIIKKESCNPEKILKLKEGASIGTSSIRRKVLLEDLRADCEVLPLRGNVPTRVEKLRTTELDGIILAKAGIDRLALDLSDFEVLVLHPREFTPAPAQGVMGYQIRTEDKEFRQILASVNDKQTMNCTNIERKTLKHLDGGCQLPLGVYCYLDPAKNYHVHGIYHNGKELVRANFSQSTHHGLAQKLYDKLKS